MKRSIHYLMSGDAHAPYLVVSLQSLRQHFDGNVIVHAFPESFETCFRIAEDPALDVRCQIWDPFYRGKNTQFINKIRLMQTITDDLYMYLDADSIVVKSLEPAFDVANQFRFTATQFGDWVSNRGTVRSRISRLVGMSGIDQVAVSEAMIGAYPSVNGGVFFCRRDAVEILEMWEKWSLIAREIFICDETVLHAVMTERFNSIFPDFGVLPGGAMNCSPKHKPKDLAEKDVVIWHGHGDTFARANKSQFGVDLWLPRYERCYEMNVGGIQEWMHKTNNRFLTTLLKKDAA